jgi:3'-phosphoadenosine 5'-phosphosulfate sulfotransferase (PAPS reductase)/FAD synthetase
MSKQLLCVSWFSAGVSSAVATWLVRDRLDHIIYTHIDDQHQDTLRFVRDCEQWFGKSVEILQSPYRTVEAAIRSSLGGYYIGGARGTPCRKILKQRVRKEWETGHCHADLTYVWGMDCDERDRAERLKAVMPDKKHLFPLIDADIDKATAHKMLRANGIKRPEMYDLGYQNNNCVGCVKGGMAYWNRIRHDFPTVFASRARLERIVGGSCINGVYLDELDPKRGRDKPPICDDCGIFCEIMAQGVTL